MSFLPTFIDYFDPETSNCIGFDVSRGNIVHNRLLVGNPVNPPLGPYLLAIEGGMIQDAHLQWYQSQSLLKN